MIGRLLVVNMNSQRKVGKPTLGEAGHLGVAHDPVSAWPCAALLCFYFIPPGIHHFLHSDLLGT